METVSVPKVRDSEGAMKSLESLDRDQLILKIQLLRNKIEDLHAANKGAQEALLKKLEMARKAKRLANARADKAVQMAKKTLISLEEVLKFEVSK